MPIFDRFIQYPWAEQALELAVQGEDPFQLRNWLIKQGLGAESARRTANILIRMWFPKEEKFHFQKQEALKLFGKIDKVGHLALHWGMCLSIFPTFRETAQVIGRLFRLQGEFRKIEVISRLLERYGNQATIKRAVERTIQTLVDWDIVVQDDGIYRGRKPKEICDSSLSAWLYLCLLSAIPDRYVPTTDLIRSLELFPFEIEHPQLAISNHLYFAFHHDASDQEIVGLRVISS